MSHLATRSKQSKPAGNERWQCSSRFLIPLLNKAFSDKKTQPSLDHSPRIVNDLAFFRFIPFPALCLTSSLANGRRMVIEVKAGSLCVSCFLICMFEGLQQIQKDVRLTFS